MIELINLSWRERIDVSLLCETFYFQSKRSPKFTKLHKTLLSRTDKSYGKEMWVFVTAVCKAVKYGFTGSKFALSKERFYEANKRYNLKISPKKMQKLLDDLELEGLITLYRGFKDEDWSMPSCFVMSEDLLDLVPEEEAKRYALVRQPEEFVKIKDYTKQTYLTDFRGHAGIRVIYKDMLAYNEFLNGQDITIDGRRVKVTYVRIFADNLQGAGRFYSTNGFTNEEAHLRKTIKINGNFATEVDFSTLHPRLIATRKGIRLPDDWEPYTLSKPILGVLSPTQKKQLRKLCKKALMAGLYASNFKEAVKAVFREYNFNKKVDGLYGGLPKITVETCGLILKDLEDSNPEIGDWFYNKDGWKVLQGMDSRLCSFIVKSMTRCGKVCLPYHDSWVCEGYNQELLISFMKDSWKEMFGTTMNFKYDVEF